MTTILEQNFSLNARETEQRLSVLRSRPIKLGVVVTTACNLKCIMCARVSKPHTLGKEALDKISALFPYLKEINWQGGEPFLAPHFDTLLEEAGKNPGLLQYITTNGTLIDAKWAKILVSARVVTQWSIDSPLPGIYEKIRAGATFFQLQGALNAINNEETRQGVNPRKEINVVVMRSNHRHLSHYIAFAKENRFSVINFHPILFNENSGENIFHEQDEHVIRFLQNEIPFIIKEAKKAGISVQTTLPLPAEAAEPSRSSPVPDHQCLYCTHPWQQLFIDASRDGKVFPECFCARSAGNIYTDTVEQIWNGPLMQEYRTRIKEENIEGFCHANCSSGMVARKRLVF